MKIQIAYLNSSKFKLLKDKKLEKEKFEKTEGAEIEAYLIITLKF